MLGGNGGENNEREIFHSRVLPTDATGAMASEEHVNLAHDARVVEEHREESDALILIKRLCALASFLHLQAAV